MEIRKTINISKDFSRTPGARYKVDGHHSAQEFLEKYESYFEEAIDMGFILLIDLDGAQGYPSSFVSGTFGKLSKRFGADVLLAHIEFKSNSQTRLDKIIREIRKPNKE